MVFGVHPAGIAMMVSGEAQMTNYPMDQAMQAALRTASLVIMGSPMNRGLFAMMTRNDVKSVKDLKGKRFGVSQLGDPPYNFALAILAKNGIGPRDVEWIPLGTDGNGRVAALVSGRVDATMLPPPAYFKLEPQGFKEIANLADYQDLYAPMAYVFKKSVDRRQSQAARAADQGAGRRHQALLRRQGDGGESVRGVRSAEHPPMSSDCTITTAKPNTYERVPYVLAPAVQYISRASGGRADRRAAEGLRFPQGDRQQRRGAPGARTFLRESVRPGIKAEEDSKASCR